MMRFAPLAVMACALSGCAWFRDSPAVTLPRPPIAANLLTQCEQLTPLADGSGATVTRKLIEVGALYDQCKRRHSSLVDAVGAPK